MTKYTLGIDVAQKVCIWVLFDPITQNPVSHGRVRPLPQDLTQWVNHIRRYPIVRAAVEASGGWEQPVVQALHQGNIPVLVANPKRVSRLREAMGWAKTDVLDAQVIALYAALTPHTTQRPSPHREKVQALLKRRGHHSLP